MISVGQAAFGDCLSLSCRRKLVALSMNGLKSHKSLHIKQEVSILLMVFHLRTSFIIKTQFVNTSGGIASLHVFIKKFHHQI